MLKDTVRKSFGVWVWLSYFYLHVLKRFYSFMTTRTQVHSLIQLMLNHEYQSKNSLLTAPACKGRRSHSETEVHTCSEGVCVTAFAWVETNNLHSHYTCFYVQEFFKRYMAVGKTFFSCFFFLSQFCEMDTHKLTSHTSRPASSSAFQLILCLLTRPTTALVVVNSTLGFGAIQ